MKVYTVYFLVKDIVSVEVSAENDENAKTKAQKQLEKEMYKSKSLECVDGLTKFAGFNIDEVWSEINE